MRWRERRSYARRCIWEPRTRYSVLLGPDYLVTRSLLSRELATAIRALKHKGESYSI